VTNEGFTERETDSTSSDSLGMPDFTMFDGAGSFAKAKDTKKTVRLLLAYTRKFLPQISLAVMAAITGTILSLVGPDRLAALTDLITAGLMTSVDIGRVTSIGFSLVVIYFASAVLWALQGQIMATVTQKLSQRMRQDLAQKINRLPMWFFSKNTTGDTLSRITNDVDALGNNLNQSLTTLIASLTMLVGALVMMLLMNWIMTVAAVASVAFGFGIMMAIMKVSQKHFDGQQKYLGIINGHIEETFTAHTIVKAYNAEKQMSQVFAEQNAHLERSAFKAQFLSGLMMPIMSFVENIGYVAVIVVGAALALGGHTSLGDIVAFLLYIRFFTQPLTQIAQLAQGLQVAAAASERIFEFLGAEEMADQGETRDAVVAAAGTVEFRKVNFSYEHTGKVIIKDFSAKAVRGQKVAIVGPTGAGKTTLVNLLMRFNEVNEGEILIDGVPTSRMTREHVRSLFCMVLQDTWLFDGTIKENVIYNKQNVSDEAVERACKAVGLHHFIRTLPNGYDTALSDKVNLSMGQRQQIAIARAMIDDAPMLILDEATSSIDTRTELHIQQAMDMLMQGRTSFVIAHRLSTIRNADLILVLNDGDIVESGKHDELMDKGGFYAELYNSQFAVA